MKQKINNYVAKHAREYNKAAVHKDKKKALKKGDLKHKKGSNWGPYHFLGLLFLNLQECAKICRKDTN